MAEPSNPEQVRARSPRKAANPDADKQLSRAFHEVFTSPAGQMVLAHLRWAFMHQVMNPAKHADRDLWFREGQRGVVGIIDQRIKEGETA